MPMKRELYPKNWKTIATIIKTLADWRCQQCDRPCLRPNEDWMDFVSDLHRIQSDWYWETYDEIHNNETGEWGYAERKGRFILTVAHLDHDPENPEPRLKALCPTCHNRHDAKTRAKNAQKTRYQQQHRGQMELFH